MQQERSLNDWIKLAYRYFSYNTLVNGSNLAAHVYNLEVKDGLAYASLGREKLLLRLESFNGSSCSCVRERCCEHLAGVFFRILSDEGYEAGQVLKPGGSGWGGRQSELKLAPDTVKDTAAAEAVQARLQTASGKQTLKAAVPAPDSSTDDWHTYFESRFPVTAYSNLKAIETMYDQVTESLMKIAADWETTLRLLYELHVSLFVMKLADQVVAERYRLMSYYDMFAVAEIGRSIAERCTDALDESLKQLDTEEVGRRYPERQAGMANVLARVAFPESSTIMPWSYVYSAVWTGLLWREDLVELEQQRLTGLLEIGPSSPEQADQYLMALIGFDIFDGKDEEAMRKAEGLQHKTPVLFYTYLHSFAAWGQWERLVKWLEWMLPFVPMLRYGTEESYFSFWSAIRENSGLDVEDRWKAAVMLLLPRSLPYYAEYLLEHGLFQEWVDIHMAVGITPLDLRVSDYKQVETNRKDLLLPWFHHSIERFIAGKNRDSYKKAIRLLKRLESLYRKLKKQDQWERYFSHIRLKYSRLRAFQQELSKLKKGEKLDAGA